MWHFYWFLKWIKEHADDSDKIRDEAGVTGTNVHNATEALNNGDELFLLDANGNGNYTIEEWQMILNYQNFYTLLKPKMIANEISLCSPELGYGGTIDRVLEFEGKRWLCDIKTSNQIADTYIMQLAAYAYLWNQFNPTLLIDDVCIVWLKSKTRTIKIDAEKNIWQGKHDDNSIQWQVVTFDEQYHKTFEDFRHLLAIWRRSNPNFRPANKSFPDKISLK